MKSKPTRTHAYAHPKSKLMKTIQNELQSFIDIQNIEDESLMGNEAKEICTAVDVRHRSGISFSAR